MGFRILSYLLGAIFLVAGVSKLFALDAFAATVGTITLLPLTTGRMIAIGIVGVEILGAIVLFTHYRTRMVSVMFCALVAVFVWVLLSAVVQGREITCNCFGNLGIALTNAQELLLDIVLFNAFAFLAYHSPAKGRVPVAGPGRRELRRRNAFVTILLGLEAVVVGLVLNTGNAGTHLRAEAAIGFAERVDPQFARYESGNRALFLMRYADLGCPLCFDDFMAFADSARATVGGGSHQVLVVFGEDQFIRNDSSSHLQRWVSANGITFPVVVAPDSVLRTIGLVKSMVIIVDRKDGVLFTERFPMGTPKRRIALRLLRSAGVPEQALLP